MRESVCFLGALFYVAVLFGGWVLLRRAQATELPPLRETTKLIREAPDQREGRWLIAHLVGCFLLKRASIGVLATLAVGLSPFLGALCGFPELSELYAFLLDLADRLEGRR